MRAFFVLCCSREEGLGSQLATYWLFQSPDPMVCLECITLLCTVTTCQVSGWDKTGVRMMTLGTAGKHTHPQPNQTSAKVQNPPPKKIPSFYRWEPLRAGSKNLIPLTLTDQCWSAFAFPAHLCLTAVARGHESQPFNLTGAFPFSAVMGILDWSTCCKVYSH